MLFNYDFNQIPREYNMLFRNPNLADGLSLGTLLSSNPSTTQPNRRRHQTAVGNPIFCS